MNTNFGLMFLIYFSLIFIIFIFEFNGGTDVSICGQIKFSLTEDDKI